MGVGTRAAELISGLIYFYGHNNAIHKGRLSKDTTNF